MTREHKFLSGNWGTCVSKYLEETVRLQSEKRREWIREIRGERLQGIAEGASSAPRLASSSAVSFPGRNECPGTHCSLVEQRRVDSSCQICNRVWDNRKGGGEDRARVRQKEKRNGRLYGVAETSKERAESRRLQRKNWSKLGLPKRKDWPQCRRESSWQDRRSRPCQKEKEQSRLSRVPGHEGGESQGGQEPHLGESEGDQSESMERKGWTRPWTREDSKEDREGKQEEPP